MPRCPYCGRETARTIFHNSNVSERRFHMKRLLNLLVPVVIILTLAVSGCEGQGIEGKGPIMVGSKVDIN